MGWWYGYPKAFGDPARESIGLPGDVDREVRPLAGFEGDLRSSRVGVQDRGIVLFEDLPAPAFSNLFSIWSFRAVTVLGSGWLLWLLLS